MLKESSKSILRDFYTDCFREPQMQPVRKFVEEQLLTASGFRDSIELGRAKAELLKLGVEAPASALERLVKQRLLRVMERRSDSEPERLELTHDMLTGIVNESRLERNRLEQLEASERERREREAQILRESEARSREAEANRFATEKQLREARRRTLVFAAAFVLAVGGLAWGWWQKSIRHRQEQTWSRDNFNFALLKSGKKLNDGRNIIDDPNSPPELRGNILALTHLARALVLDPRNSNAARLTVKLLSQKLWCPPMTPVLEYGRPGKGLLATTWAPDGKIVSVAEDGTVLRADRDSTDFDTAAAQQLDPRPDKLSSAAFSIDGKWLLTVRAGSEGLPAQLWKWNDASPGREAGYRNDVAELKPFTLNDNVRAVACDGKRLIIITWNPDFCEVRPLAQHPGEVDAAFQDELRKGNISAADSSADGKYLVTGSTAGQAALWNLDESAQPSRNFDHKNAQGGMERIFSVAVNPAKPQFVTVSLDNVRLWNSKAEQAEQKPIFLRPVAARDRIFRASFSRDGNYLITGTTSGLAQIWDVRRKTTIDKGDYVLGPLGEPVYHIGTAGTGMIGYVGFSPAGDAFVTCAGPDFRKPDSLHFWGMPRTPLRAELKTGAIKQAPTWLPELAEAVSGWQLTPHGYQATPVKPSLTKIEKKIPASASSGN